MSPTLLRRLSRPGWILSHLVIIAIAVGLVSLGLWQLDRHQEVSAYNARLESLIDLPPVPLDQLDPTSPESDFRAVTVTGTYAGDSFVTLGPRTFNDAPGYDVLRVLQTDDGPIVVNQGWMPFETEPPLAPTGTVTVTGRARAPIDSRQVLTDDDGRITFVANVDLEVLAADVPGLDTDVWIERTDAAALDARTLPRPALPVSTEGGNHLFYAAQWFAFAVIGLIGYPLLIRRRLVDESAERNREGQPDDPADDATGYAPATSPGPDAEDAPRGSSLTSP